MTPQSVEERLDQYLSAAQTATAQRTDGHYSLPFFYALAVKLGVHSLPGHLITVTGTNGKGSVVRILERIYQEAGYRVAAVTSPHLSHFSERIALDSKPAPLDWIVSAFEAIERVSTVPVGFYPSVPLVAALCIQRYEPDIVLFEVGVGGRLDFCNIYDADVSIVTSIDLDHQHLLGDTRELIGREKAFIARPGRPLVCGDPDMPHSVEQVASMLSAELLAVDKAFSYQADKNTWTWRAASGTHYQGLPMPRIRLDNAATALMGVTALQSRLPVSRKAIEDGLRNTFHAARFEQCIYENREVYLDVAHNPQSMRWLAEQLSALPPPGQLFAILGMKSKKDYASALRALMAIVDVWVLVPINHEQGLCPQILEQEVKALGGKVCYNFELFDEALSATIGQMKPDDRLVICGSFYLVGEARDKLVGAIT